MTNFGINGRSLILAVFLLAFAFPAQAENPCKEWLDASRATRSFQLNYNADSMGASMRMTWMPRGEIYDEKFPIMIEPYLMKMLTPGNVLQSADDLSPYRLNLQRNQVPFHEHPFLGAAMLQATANVIDITKVYPFASLNFLAYSDNSNASAVVSVETDLTRRLSGWKVGGRWGVYYKKVTYQAYVQVPLAHMDWVNVPLSRFQLSDLDLREQYPFVTTPQKPLSVRVQFSGGAYVGDKMDFSVDLNQGDADAFIDNLFLDRRNGFFFMKGYDKMSDDQIKSVLKEAFHAAGDVSNQKFADDLVEQGDAAIRAFFARYGWKMETILNGHVGLGTIARKLQQHDLVREGGSFGDVHGPYAHIKAFAAILNGIPFEKGMLFMDFVSDYIGTSSLTHIAAWTLWDVFFESRGYGPFSIRYWRDTAEQRQWRMQHRWR